MGRFTAEIEGSDFVVRDTHDSDRIVIEMPKSDLHGPGGGGSGALATLTDFVINAVEREFETPYGAELEMGFDLEFELTAPGGGSAKEVGIFALYGIMLGVPVLELDTHTGGGVGTGFLSRSNQSNSKVYPGGSYAPLVVLRTNSNLYNVCAAICCDVTTYNHPFNIVTSAFATGTEVEFQARSPGGAWATIPAGLVRKYAVSFRINDRTNTNIGPAADAPQEWLWTVRGYQRYFRARYGKPNYRAMGGWNGRTVATLNASAGTHADPGNLRSWNPDRDPLQTDGYQMFATQALAKKALNIDRVIIWALSGWHPPAFNLSHNYPFRFATGIFDADMNSTAQNSVHPALERIRHGGLQQGLWWGRCTQTNNSSDWKEPQDPAVFIDLSNPTTIALALAESDLAVLEWGSTVIGLDAYAFTNPGDGVRWLQILKARYPRALLITEIALPDIYHVIAPTYIIEPFPQGSYTRPYWLHHYINPGSECHLQFDYDAGDQAIRTTEVADMGFTPCTGYLAAISAGTRAVDRWSELGEVSITSYDTAIAGHTSRDRDKLQRAMIR